MNKKYESQKSDKPIFKIESRNLVRDLKSTSSGRVPNIDNSITEKICSGTWNSSSLVLFRSQIQAQ